MFSELSACSVASCLIRSRGRRSFRLELVCPSGMRARAGRDEARRKRRVRGSLWKRNRTPWFAGSRALVSVRVAGCSRGWGGGLGRPPRSRCAGPVPRECRARAIGEDGPRPGSPSRVFVQWQRVASHTLEPDLEWPPCRSGESVVVLSPRTRVRFPAAFLMEAKTTSVRYFGARCSGQN